MKNRKPLLLLFLFSFPGLTAKATDYFIAANGNDLNSGTSTASPWKTVSKVNNSLKSLRPGDQILFRRGDIFYGDLKITQSSGTAGKPIKIGSYGAGNKPIITGFTSVTSWTNVGGNIWESTSRISSLAYTNMVTVNGVNTAMGKYPNSGYLQYQHHVGKTAIISNQLPSGTDWTGAELAWFITTWTFDRTPITRQNGDSIFFTTSSTENVQADNQKFLIQSDIRTLDVQNEWYYDPSSGKINIYSISAPTNVNVATIDTLFYIDGSNYITIDGIQIIGANQMGVVIRNSKFVTVENCDINFAGIYGIYGPYWGNSKGSSVINNTLSEINDIAVYLTDDLDSATVSGNEITDAGVLPGMGGSLLGLGKMYSAMVVTGKKNVIEDNIIKRSGYIGIYFYGDSVKIRRNFIDSFCLMLNDGGGIYTWNEATKTPFFGVEISNNIVMHGDQGIYLDYGSNGIDIFNNTVAYNRLGFLIGDTWNTRIHDNVAFGNAFTQIELFNTSFNNVQMRDIEIIANSFVSTSPNQYTAYLEPLKEVYKYVKADYNYYARPIGDSLSIGTEGGSKSLPQIKTLTGQESHSLPAPKKIEKTEELRLEYNNSHSVKTISLDGNYIDFDNNSYNGKILIDPFSSRVLIRNGPTQEESFQVNAGTNQTIVLPKNSIELSGNVSPTDAFIKSYHWSKVTGPDSYNFLDVSSAVTRVSDLVEGVYVFELTVTDNKGATATSRVQITVGPAANVAPTANAGSNKTITLPVNTVSLAGSGSDADGAINSYQWSKVSGPSSFNIVNPSSAVTDVSGLVQGVYVFELKVTDNKGATGTSRVQVTVNPAVNVAPTADAGSNKTITLPVNTVSLAGSGSDADGAINSYQWTKVSGPSSFNIVNPSSATTNISGLVQGVYVFELKVTDNKGATGTARVQVTVNPAANIAPTANAGSNKTITLPTNTVSLAGSGSDADGTIISYQWTKVSGPVTFKIVNPASAVTDVFDLVEGVYVFELKVTDNSQASAQATVEIIVNGVPSNQPLQSNIQPNVMAGNDTTILAPVNFVTLNGNAFDRDGTIIGYVWEQISGPSQCIISPDNEKTTNVSNLIEGMYEIELKATDDNGSVGRDTLRIVVVAGRLAVETVSLSVLPNPAIDVVTLEIGSYKERSNTLVTITDMSGKRVYRKLVISNTGMIKEKIDMSYLEKGVYVVTVLFDGLEQKSIKVVKI